VLESGERIESKPFATDIKALRITGLPSFEDDSRPAPED
jgi:hypothetical protein